VLDDAGVDPPKGSEAVVAVRVSLPLTVADCGSLRWIAVEVVDRPCWVA
jgi:hypothetical protein